MAKDLDPKYFTGLIAETFKAFYDERGSGCRYRCTLLGVDGYKKAHPENIGKEMTPQEAFEATKKYLIESGVVEDVTFSEEHEFADVVNVTFKNCAQWHTEVKLKEMGIPVYACPCANVMSFNLEQGGKFTTELATFAGNKDLERTDDGTCRLSMSCFEKKLGNY
ncbi:MAG: hypothetical protein LBT32_03440 [Peptococcaceae bacterium]|jgi:hypothetical protein|nr:hypothetical protein [Peptococcaceae bacterium]